MENHIYFLLVTYVDLIMQCTKQHSSSSIYGILLKY